MNVSPLLVMQRLMVALMSGTNLHEACFDRAKYYRAFNEFDHSGHTHTMQEIVGKALTNSYYKRLAYLEHKSIMSLAGYAKRNKLSHSNLLNKAHRQTVEAFFEKGRWKIGAEPEQ